MCSRGGKAGSRSIQISSHSKASDCGPVSGRDSVGTVSTKSDSRVAMIPFDTVVGAAVIGDGVGARSLGDGAGVLDDSCGGRTSFPNPVEVEDQSRGVAVSALLPSLEMTKKTTRPTTPKAMSATTMTSMTM